MASASGILRAWCLATLVASSAAAQDVPKNELRIVTLTGYPTAPFPNTSWDWGAASLMPVMFDALTEVDEDGKIVPALATSWRSEDELTWVFTLRRDAHFSNGEPFTAEAVVSAIAYLSSPEGKTLTLAREADNIVAVEPRGENEVIIRTREPDAMLPGRMRGIYMLPPIHFAKVGKDGFARAPHGTGPYQVLKLVTGRGEFVANPYAWREPNVGKLTFFQVGESLARIQAVMSGGADIAFNRGAGRVRCGSG
jgi:peptide/nickel transport system substrate-binding protein